MCAKSKNEDGLTFQVASNSSIGQQSAVLKFNGFDVGTIIAETVAGIEAQFDTLSELVLNDGAMVRHSLILTGYHTEALQGDVLHIDGELCGSWSVDDEEWFEFKAEGSEEETCSAPSLWRLHDAIAKWMEDETVT